MSHIGSCLMPLQRLNEARRMMDKLRACIVANYFANAGMPKVSEVSRHRLFI